VGLAGPGAGGASSNTNGEMDMPMFLEVVWRSRLSLKRAELLGTFVLIFFLGGLLWTGPQKCSNSSFENKMVDFWGVRLFV